MSPRIKFAVDIEMPSTHVQFLRIKKLTGQGIVHLAARHNLREIYCEQGLSKESHIDLGRTSLNRVLKGPTTAAEVSSLAQDLMGRANISKLRKDAVRALEVIFSLPASPKINQNQFFEDSVAWSEKYFAVPILSSTVHNDESFPHCHVLLLPLVSGRMVGSDLFGNRTKLQATQADFYTVVGKHYGLKRQVAHKRLCMSIRRQAAHTVYDEIRGDPALLLSPEFKKALIDTLAKDPEPLIRSLGLSLPRPKHKGTFVGIMTKPCITEKPIGIERDLRSQPL